MQANLDPRFAGVIGLGAPVSHHPMSRRGRLGYLFMALICFALTPLFLALTAERYDLANNTDAPIFVNTSPGYVYWPAVVGVLLLLLGVGLLLNMLRHWHTIAAVYEHGLALNDPAGLRQVRWDAVDNVRQAVTKVYRNGAHVNTVYVYTVRTNDGQTLKFDNRFVSIEELGNAIQRNVAIALLPRYVQTLNHGQRLSFGPVAVDRECLYAGNRSLPWREITALKIESGNIAVKQEGGWFNWAPIAVSQVPNLLVFQKIAGRLAGME